MTDIVTKENRSRMMSRIKGKNTRPEIVIRRELHALGFRYRLHVPELPGKPDMVLPKYSAVIFINGCFWHGHDCELFQKPTTNAEFWRHKISRNQENDRKNLALLESAGWRVLTVWECSIRGRQKHIDQVVSTIVAWLLSSSRTGDVRG